MAHFIGTSGWAYPEWKPGFYPEGLPQTKFLEHYASRLGACEVNATFYRLQAASTFEKWAAAVPEDFRFAIKMHRRLTHSATFMETEEDTEFLIRFLESVEPLGSRLGPLLVQLPPSRRLAADALDRMLGAIGPNRSVACEFRHASWSDPTVDAVLTSHGATRCFADTEGPAPGALPAGKVAYVRLRAERYDDSREDWLELIRREAETREVVVFAKHKGVPAGDPFTGVGLADWLATALSGPTA